MKHQSVFQSEIPKFRFKAGVTNGWNGILDGEPEFGVKTSPITGSLQFLSNLLTDIGIQFMQMGGSGIMIADDGESFNLEIEPNPEIITIDEETETDLRGDVTFILPDGITLEDFQTANGWEVVEEVDGRQKITVSLESLVAGDEVSFKVKVSYWYIFYPNLDLSNNYFVANRLESSR